MTDEPPRKERVIHTRISEQLERELKEKAARLGVSVSNLVRNVLSNTLDLVEDVVADSVRVASSVVPGHPAAKSVGDGSVIGWQEVVLNLNAVCDTCNAILPKGTRGAVGLSAVSGAQRRFLCMTCLGRLTDGASPSPSEAATTGEER